MHGNVSDWSTSTSRDVGTQLNNSVHAGSLSQSYQQQQSISTEIRATKRLSVQYPATYRRFTCRAAQSVWTILKTLSCTPTGSDPIANRIISGRCTDLWIIMFFTRSVGRCMATASPRGALGAAPFCWRCPQIKILPYNVMFKALTPLKDTTLIISCLIMSDKFVNLFAQKSRKLQL